MGNEGPKNSIKGVSDSAPQQPQSPPDALALVASLEERIKNSTPEERNDIFAEMEDNESLLLNAEEKKGVMEMLLAAIKKDLLAANAIKTAEPEKKSGGAVGAANLPKVEEKVEEGDKTPNEVREEFERTVREASVRLDDSEKVELVGPEGSESKGPEGEKTPEEDAVYLANRSKEIDAEAKKLGIVESSFRKIGERYNKLGWKSKLGVGVALGIGAVAFSSFSLPSALVWSGIAAQRIAGAASIFVKSEKDLQAAAKGESKGFITRRGWYKWVAEKAEKSGRQKETAMLMAGLYSAVMLYGIKGAVHLGSESIEWLKHFYTLNHDTIAVPASDVPVVNEVPQPAAAAAAGESAASVHAPEMPAVSVDASAGHGYEYMLKQLSEQLHDPAKHFTLPPNTDPNSDIAKLFAADTASIDTVVHQIASDPQHGFFNTDGTSVQINPNEHLIFGNDGQIYIANEETGNVSISAPEGAPVTPVYSPEAVTAPVVPEAPIPHVETAPPAPEVTHQVEAPTSSVEPHNVPAEAPAHTGPETIQQSSEIIQRHSEGGSTVSEFSVNDENLKDVKFRIITDGSGHSKVLFDGTFSNSQESVQKHLAENWSKEIESKGHNMQLGRPSVMNAVRSLEIDERALKYLENNNQGNSTEAKALKSAIKNIIEMTEKQYGHVLNDSIGADGQVHILNSHTPSVETSVPHVEAPAIHENIVINHSGVEIATDKPHFYEGSDGKDIFAYGGASAEEKLKAIKEYLTENPDKTVYSADANGEHRIPWHITPKGELIGVPEKTNGFFGLLKSFVKAPEPDDFGKFIK